MKQEPSTSPEPLGGHAVVIGGSITGLLAARVLADYFASVTVVESDDLSQGCESRKGVPQGRQLHILVHRGIQILESFFPGILAALVADGAHHINLTREVRWYVEDAWKPSCDGDLTMLTATRPFVEHHIKERTARLTNVRILPGHRVLALEADRAEARVSGVRIEPLERKGAEQTLAAELIVDASGRGSAAPRWLKELGFPVPEESSIKIHLGYASRLYRRPANGNLPWRVLYVKGTPPHSRRLGALVPVEGGRWMCTLGGMVHDYPPTDPEGFLAFARSLPAADIYQVLKDAEPLSDVATYRFPSSLRRRYERLPRFLDGFIVSGDAVSSFNPIYGQGMTMAALGAVTLAQSLRERSRRRPDGRNPLAGFAQRFQQALGQVVDVPWEMTTLEDYRHPEIDGMRPFGYSLRRWYIERLHRASLDDAGILRTLYGTLHLVAPPTAILHPRVLYRVLRASSP